MFMNTLKPVSIERREYPRVNTEWPATLYYEDDTEIQTTIINISRIGLQIKCSKMVASTMLSDRFQPIPGKAAKVTVIFEITPDSGQEIMVQCEVVRAQRSSQNEFNISFKYLDMDESYFKLIDSYITKIYPKH